MSEANTAAPILPRNGRADKPLWIVMSIMAFMASLALLLTSMSNRTSTAWQSELRQSASVQIYLGDVSERADAIAQTNSIIKAEYPDATTRALTEAEAKTLIEPWIGDVELPSDIPLPVMIAIDYDGTDFDKTTLTATLKNAGIVADVDNHDVWAVRVRRAARAVRIGTSLIMVLLLAGSIAATGFATQSAMAVHEKVVKVLTQVGAQDRYIAELFVKQFFVVGAKAGLVGIIGAFIFTFTIGILFGGERETSLLPALRFTPSDIMYLILIPILFGVVSAAAAGITSLQALKANRAST